MLPRNSSDAKGGPPTRVPGDVALARVLRDARPLTARSVVASTLLGVDPPQLPARLLVRSGALFGIADGTTRVALSRMVASGELRADGSHYRLAGHLAGRQARQQISRHGATKTWDGTWMLAVVTAAARSAPERAALRNAARHLRLAELRPGVWTRPDNLPPTHDDAAGEALALLSAVTLRFLGAPSGNPTDDPAELAARLWDLPAWAARAELLDAALTALHPTLAADEPDLGPAFTVAASTLRHLQADPLLPDRLLPPHWPGASLRSTYEHFDETFKQAWRGWFRRHA